MFRAAEWLKTVRDAAYRAREEEALLATLPSSSSTTAVASSSDPDRMTTLIDRRMAAEERLAECTRELNSAQAVFDGMRNIGRLEFDAAAIMEMYCLKLMTWEAIALALAKSTKTCRRRWNYGVDWLDSHGLAHAKAGIGMAT